MNFILADLLEQGKLFLLVKMEKWYEKYTGFPYAHLGNSIKTGIDCFNLIRYVYKQECDIIIPYDTSDFCNILDEQWYNKTHEKPFEKGATLQYGWEKINKPDIRRVNIFFSPTPSKAEEIIPISLSTHFGSYEPGSQSQFYFIYLILLRIYQLK